MAAPSVGIVANRYFQTGKEATHGTSVAATRRWNPEGIAWNPGRRKHFYGGSRGTANPRSGATNTGALVEISYKGFDGASWAELVFPLSNLDSGQTGTGAGADKAWTFAVNRTTPEDYETYTIEVGDETQEYEAEYCFVKSFTLSGDASNRDNMTELSIEWVGRQSTKSTKTGSLSVSDVRIPAYLWTPRFATAQSGLAGASDVANFLRTWSLTVETGLVAHFYGDGNTYFGQVVRSQPVDATLSMTVDSNAQAVSQFNDKSAANTMDFIQFKALGPTLGSSNYSAQFQMAALYEDPVIIDGDVEGVNTYSVVAHLADDDSGPFCMSWAVTNGIAALTA